MNRLKKYYFKMEVFGKPICVVVWALGNIYSNRYTTYTNDYKITPLDATISSNFWRTLETLIGEKIIGSVQHDESSEIDYFLNAQNNLKMSSRAELKKLLREQKYNEKLETLLE